MALTTRGAHAAPQTTFSAVRVKVLGTVLAVGATASVAGMGTMAGFTGTTSASLDVATGTVRLAVGGTGLTNDLSVAATDVLPGDTIERAADLVNSGAVPLTGFTLSTSGTGTVLTTDTKNGLQLSVDSCSTAWTNTAATGAPPTYTCAGTVTTLVSAGSVLQTGTALGALNADSPGGVDHLRVYLTLPTTADDTFQGVSDTVTLRFDAAQASTPTAR